MIWRHLFNERVGRGARCLDVGCGSGLQSIQLADRVSAATADLYEWVPEARYDVIVASLFQLPVHPLDPDATPHPADFWGRTAVDHLIGVLPQALADDGVAYVLQVSILSQQRTDEVLERHGLQARVADFGFLPFTENFRRVAEQVAHVERISDAHHLEISGDDVLVAYLLEIRHGLSAPRHE